MTSEADPEPAQDERTTVLEVFGMKLSVKNRRLAEVLTMDAAEALGMRGHREDVPGAADSPQPDRDVISEAVPDVLVPVMSPSDEEESRLRASLRDRVHALGAELGFGAGEGSTWISPSGVSVHTRVITRPLSPAAAADAVRKLATLVLGGAPATQSVLIVTATREAIGPLVLAIKRDRAHGSFKVVCIDDLVRLAEVHVGLQTDHAAVVALLVPYASVDLCASLTLLDSVSCAPGDKPVSR